MKPSEYCKQVGLSSLKEMSDISGVDRHTLMNWWENRQSVFKSVAIFSSAEKHGVSFKDIINLIENKTKADSAKSEAKFSLEVVRNEIDSIIKGL